MMGPWIGCWPNRFRARPYHWVREALARALEVQANREAMETQRSETRAARAAAAEFLNYDRLISQVLTVVYSSGT